MDMNSSVNQRLWAGILTGPLSFLITLQANYMLVDLACGAGVRRVLHLMPPIAILVTATSGVLAWKASRELSHGPSTAGDVALSRGRFMAFTGIMASTFFVLVLLAQWVPVFFVNPCQR
jgi:hypothetical protein